MTDHTKSLTAKDAKDAKETSRRSTAKASPRRTLRTRRITFQKPTIGTTG